MVFKKHSKVCQLNPEVNKKVWCLQKESSIEGSVSIWKHDEVRIKKRELLDMFVGELPFKLVKNQLLLSNTEEMKTLTAYSNKNQPTPFT